MYFRRNGIAPKVISDGNGPTLMHNSKGISSPHFSNILLLQSISRINWSLVTENLYDSSYKQNKVTMYIISSVRI